MATAERTKATAELPVGSKWYRHGHHWEIVAHTYRDGEPAVYIKEKGARKRVPCAIIARLFLKQAVPSEGW